MRGGGGGGDSHITTHRTRKGRRIYLLHPRQSRHTVAKWLLPLQHPAHMPPPPPSPPCVPQGSSQANTRRPPHGRLLLRVNAPPVGPMFHQSVISLLLAGPIRVVGGLEAMSREGWGQTTCERAGGGADFVSLRTGMRAVVALIRAYSAHVDGIPAPTREGTRKSVGSSYELPRVSRVETRS